MNKNIYLDNLINFSVNTYSNLYQNYINLSKCDINNEINKIKNNNSMNEKGVFIQYNYVELSALLDIKYNELVLIYPLSFNMENSKKIEWYNLLNALLLVLNNDYFNQTNNIKKKYIDSLNDQLENKIKFTNEFTNNIFNNIINITCINLIILNYDNQTKVKIFNNKASDKYIVIYKFNNDYLPVCNFDTKYYLDSSIFIKYLQSLVSNENIINNENLIINEHIETKNDYYDDLFEASTNIDELHTIEDYTLHVSEAVEQNIIKKCKKKKNDKNIFISNKIDKSNSEDSVFNKTESILPEEILKIYDSFKNTTKLEEIQNLSLKIGLNIFYGSTKDGKPKNKTKTELLDEIKSFINK